jgi:hypothetical protein
MVVVIVTHVLLFLEGFQKLITHFLISRRIEGMLDIRVAFVKQFLRNLLFFPENFNLFPKRLFIIGVGLLQFLVSGDNALGDVFQFLLAGLVLAVVGVVLLDLVQVGLVQILLRELVVRSSGNA